MRLKDTVIGTLKQRKTNNRTLNKKLYSRYSMQFYEVCEEGITVYL
jgi:hypothetical protein